MAAAMRINSTIKMVPRNLILEYPTSIMCDVYSTKTLVYTHTLYYESSGVVGCVVPKKSRVSLRIAQVWLFKPKSYLCKRRNALIIKIRFFYHSNWRSD